VETCDGVGGCIPGGRPCCVRIALTTCGREPGPAPAARGAETVSGAPATAST
jgi:hypothetical protein